MDAITITRVSEFMATYVTSDFLDPSTDPAHRAPLERSLTEFRLISDDLARVEAMLGEVASQRAFIQWMNERIEAATQRGEDTYLLRWDRGFAGAKIREIQDRLPVLLGTSLEARLTSSRESFRSSYLDSGALGRASVWAGDDPAIQAALDGMLIPESAQAVVNQYLHSIGTLQRDSAMLAQALSVGGSLARSPQRKQYEATLADWQRRSAAQAQTVMDIFKGTVDADRLDPVPWSERVDLTVATRPPASAAQRRAFQLAEDRAWLTRLSQEARAIEDAISALDAQRRGGMGAPPAASQEVRDASQRRYELRQKARLVNECLAAVQARWEKVRTTEPYGDGGLRAVDLEVANARRKLDAFNAQGPVDTASPSPQVTPDDALHFDTLPAFKSEYTHLQRSHEALVGTTQRLSVALDVPKGFQLTEGQQAEQALLRSQRAVLAQQKQLVQQELTRLKALIDNLALSQRRGLPVDLGRHQTLYSAWEAAKTARLEGEQARQAALAVPPPDFVAWKHSVRSGRSRAQTVTTNYLLTAEENTAVRAQIEADRQASVQWHRVLRDQDKAIGAAQAHVDLLGRQGASATDKADAPSAQSRLIALQSLRTALAHRLVLLDQRLADGEALRTSSTPGQVGQRQQAILTTTSLLPNAWLDQLRQERSLAHAELAVAQRALARLQATAGISNAALLEAQRLLTYRERAATYAAARVVVQEAELGIRTTGTPLETARQSLLSSREGMQIAYFDLAHLRQIYRADSLGSQLRRAQSRNASMQELRRLQAEVAATETAWPRSLDPFPQTVAAKATAVQARYGDELPE